MGPMDVAAIGMPLVGAGLGYLFSRGDRKKADALEQLAMQQYGEISVPVLKELQAQLISSGQWDALPSDFGNKNARDEAISRLMEVGESGGMDSQSVLAQEQARQSAAAQEARGRASVRQEAQRRGMGGAGEFIGQLGAQQAGAQSAALAGMQNAASARDRALQALMQGGSMAGQAEAQDFNRAATINRERDALARYNADMSMRVQEGNNALRQQGFGNNMQLAGARYGVYHNRANQLNQRADRTMGTWFGLGQGAQGAALSAGQMGGYGGGNGGGGGAPPAAAAAQPPYSAYTRPQPKYSLEDVYGMDDYPGY